MDNILNLLLEYRTEDKKTKIRGQKSDVGDPQITQITRIRRKGPDVGNLRFRKTWDIIEAAERGLLPDKIMINVHPRRWTDRPLPWVKELVEQNVKNVVKRVFYVRDKREKV